MTTKRPICSLSLDLDNQWSYMKTHGDPGWESFPSYLDLVVPRFLEILETFGWKITVFVVGQDAALEKNHDALRMIVEAGHEIGNHSFNHEPWLHLYSRQQIEDEIVRAEDSIERVTAVRPQGFRGPGYSFSKNLFEVLAHRGYLYDASTLPTFIGPLARAYYFMTSGLSKNDRDRRNALFGNFRDGLRPLRPFQWSLEQHSLLEIPVTTLPLARLPIHFSYLFYLAGYSKALASAYFKCAMALVRGFRVEPSLLLHPLDFMTADDVPELSFFPAMRYPHAKKLALMNQTFGTISRTHRVVSLSQHARHVCSARPLPVRRWTDD